MSSLLIWYTECYSALMEAQDIFGLDFDPAEFEKLAKEGLESGEEDEGEEEDQYVSFSLSLSLSLSHAHTHLRLL